MLFARWTDRVNTNPLACGNAPAYLHVPYPELPPIKVGELQWPTGASRYGRALYAVDWESLLAIMSYCFGYEPTMSEDEPPVAIKPDDIPSQWNNGDDDWKHLVVEINGGDNGYFRANMAPLSPHRVTGSGVELWLLPLVDCRYFRDVYNDAMTDPTWDEALSELADAQSMFTGKMSNAFGDFFLHTYSYKLVNPSYGNPDPRLTKPEQPQFASQLLDVAALSVGLRVVHNPMTDRVYAMNPYVSSQRRMATLAVQPFGITGEVSTALDDSGLHPYAYLPRMTSLGTTGSFIATGLPAGLEIDSVTGVITGTLDSDDDGGKMGGPAESGVFTVQISRGGFSYTFTLVVIPIADSYVTSARLISGAKAADIPTPSYEVYCLRDGLPTQHYAFGGTRLTISIWTTWEDRPNGDDPSPPDGKIGESYSYNTTVGTSGSHSATNLPPGLTINLTTGEISGTPTESGEFEVEITRGATVATLTIEIFKDSEAATSSFVSAIANALASWSNRGSQYCFAGPISYEPNGFDDFCSIDLFELNPGEYVFRSRIYELPPYWMPSVVLAGGEEPSCSRRNELYRFEMTEDIASGDGGETPPTTVITNFPKTLTVSEKAILVNVDGMIDGARAGFVGECKYEAQKYWFVQAACGQICDSAVNIPAQTPDNARIGQNNYSWTPTVSGTPTAGSFGATGLPDDWEIDADTGEITGPYAGSGVLGPEGYVEITITCTGPKSPPAEGTCTATRKVKIRIVGA